MKLSKLLSPQYYRAPTISEELKKQLVLLRGNRWKLRLKISKGMLGVGTFGILITCVILGVIIHNQVLYGDAEDKDQAVMVSQSENSEVLEKSLADVQEEYAVQNTDDSMASEHLNIVGAGMGQQDSFYKIVQSTIIWGIIVLGVGIFTGIILRKRRSSKKKQ